MLFLEEDRFKGDFGIYAIRNILNNKVYIGQTSENFQRRYWHHKWKLNNNCHDNEYLQNSWNKYGEDNFEYFVIEVVDDEDMLDDLEICYIEKYKSINLSYNILNGGGGRRGIPMSSHAKAIIGEKNKKHMTGKTHSDTTKAKMSYARTGKKYTRYKKTTICNDDLIRQIKIDLIKGIKPSVVANKYNVSYKCINGIISNNTWSNIIVDGWEEFYNSRRKSYRLKPEDHDVIRQLQKDGMTKHELADIYNKNIKTIEKILRR